MKKWGEVMSINITLINIKVPGDVYRNRHRHRNRNRYGTCKN